MSVTLNDNAIITFESLLRRLNLTYQSSPANINDISGDKADTLKNIINQASDVIESFLTVEQHGRIFKGYVKKRTVTNEVFTGSGNSLCYSPIYPVVSISSLQYTTDYGSWTDYSGAKVVNPPYQIFLPASSFSSGLMASRVSGDFGYTVIPPAIEKVCEEMCQKAWKENPVSGKDLLGISSQGINSQASSSVTYFQLEKSHKDILKQFKMPIIAQAFSITR